MLDFKHIPRYPIVLLLAIQALCACTNKQPATSSIFGQSEIEENTAVYDLDDIEQSGDLIAATISGPDTYFEYHGREFGLEYTLASAFASTIGTRLRMELVSDTTLLLKKLQSGEVDIAVFPIDSTNTTIVGNANLIHLAPKWLVRKQSPALAQAINTWWQPNMRTEFANAFEVKVKTYRQSARRIPQPMVLDRAHGIISRYDNLFRRYASTIGWDWRLLAAQCFQESAFDPNAVSWMGAQGLMQLMPGTASEMGLQPGNVFQPESNIAAAVRLLNILNTHFSSIADKNQRLCFILASYNGGEGHVRDAMALATKYQRNAHDWSDVSDFILKLSNATYYRDPCVKRGYMRGTETVQYVQNILSHYKTYQTIR